MSTLEPFIPSGFEAGSLLTQKLSFNSELPFPAMDLDFVFNPASFLMSDQESQVSAHNLFQPNLDGANQSQYAVFSQIPSKSNNLDLNLMQNVDNFTWDANLPPQNCDLPIASPSSLAPSAAISPSQEPSKLLTTPLMSPSPCSEEESSFKMTCPLPLCQFQSGKLIQIWRHITWEHVGTRAMGTAGMEELVEKVVMGASSGN